MSEHALRDVVVIELAGSLGAAYCGKLLADLGASVTIVEDAAGHPLRRTGATRPGAGHSGLFAYAATNKRSTILSSSDTAAFGALIERADILITDGQSPLQGLVPAELPERVIRLDLSPYGRSGRYADWQASDLTLWALGGHMYFIGEKSREPLLVPGSQAEFHAGVQAAIAALAALNHQREHGQGQSIEVSALEALLSAHSWLSVAWSHAGTVLDRTTHDLIRCSDGWVCFMQPVPYLNLFLMIGRPERMEEPQWATLGQWGVQAAETYAQVAEWCASRTCDEVVESAQALRMACARVNDAAALANSAQLESRRWWLDVEDPALGSIRLPGFPYRLTDTPATLDHPAPSLGEHTNASLPARSAVARSLPPSHAPSPAGPLEGVKVIEVTANWAGPVCARHLADLGADVIKVESPIRPATRGGFWPHMDPQRQGYNRAGYFNLMNRNKRDVVLDLASPEGHEVFLDLVRDADILIENNSARVMPNLGLAYDTLKEVNPRLIMISICGSGADGPERDYLAYGVTIEASCGLAALTGYDESQVYRTGSAAPGAATPGTSPHMGNYADPVTGAHGAVAALAALEARRHTGRGQWVDVAMTEATMGLFADSLVDFQLNGVVHERCGNRDPRYAPQGAYRCAGIDNWLALTVQSDAEWPALARIIGRDDLAADSELATLDGRHRRADELDAAISEWAAGREQYEAAWELQGAGIAAAPVLANWQVLADPHLFDRKFYKPIDHPAAGVYPFPSWAWRLDRTPATMRRHAPMFGEHNAEIFAQVGLDAAQVADLYEKGVTSDAPR